MKMYICGIAFVLCSVMVSAAQQPAVARTPPSGPPATNSNNERYLIGYQDTLDIQVFRGAG